MHCSEIRIEFNGGELWRQLRLTRRLLTDDDDDDDIVLTWLPKCRRAKSRTTSTTALANVPAVPVNTATTMDAVDILSGGRWNDGKAFEEVFSTLPLVVKLTSSLAFAILAICNDPNISSPQENLNWNGLLVLMCFRSRTAKLWICQPVSLYTVG